MFYSARHWSTVEAVLAPFRLQGGAAALANGLIGRACIDYARSNGVLALFADRVTALDMLDRLEAGQRGTLERFVAEADAGAPSTRAARLEVLETLDADGVPAVMLKGGALSETLYDRPGLRPTRDLDVLVPVDLIDRARAALERIEFTALPGSEEPGHHLPRLVRPRCRAGGVTAVDLHYRLVPKSIYGFKLGELQGLWRRVVWLELAPGRAVRTLSRRDHVLHLHVHMFHHVFYNFRLIHLLDIVLAARRWTDLDWGEIARELDCVGLRPFRRELWSWIAAFLGDSLDGANPPAARSEARGAWLLQHGSLPMFSPLSYSRSAAEWGAAFPSECRRYFYRTFRAPGWRPFAEAFR